MTRLKTADRATKTPHVDDFIIQHLAEMSRMTESEIVAALFYEKLAKEK